MFRHKPLAALALLIAIPALALLVAARACNAKGLGDCDRKVPGDAERVFQSVAAAFRKGDAAGITASMQPEARLYLALSGVDSGSFAREQATALLEKEYFPKRKILSLTPGEGCTTGDEVRLSRTFRLRVQVGHDEHEGTLTVEIVKKKIDDKSSMWFLGSIKEP